MRRRRVGAVELAVARHPERNGGEVEDGADREHLEGEADEERDEGDGQDRSGSTQWRGTRLPMVLPEKVGMVEIIRKPTASR